MNLNSRTLSSTIMSGAPVTDEQQAVNLRYRGGGRVLDAYNRTGNMRVANTLSNYQGGGYVPPAGLSDIASGKVSFEDPFAQQQQQQQEQVGQTPSWFAQNQRNISGSIIDAGSLLAGISPNLANIKDYRTLPQVPTPGLERAIDLDVPDFESTRQAIVAQGRNMQNLVSSGQAGQQIAQRSQAMGRTQGALSQLAGQEERMQTDINNRNRVANQQVQARNLGTVNKFYDEQNERELAIIRGVGAERQNISNKILGTIGDMNQRRVDRDKMSLTGLRYNQEGALRRTLQDSLQAAIKSGDQNLIGFYSQQLQQLGGG